jgi:hypothetical protein
MSYLFLTVVPAVIFVVPFVLLVCLFVEIAKTEKSKVTAGISSLFLVLVALLGLWANEFAGTFGSFLFLVLTLTMCSGKESK